MEELHHGSRVELGDLGKRSPLVIHSVNGSTFGKVTSDDDDVLVYDKTTRESLTVKAGLLTRHKPTREELIGRWTRQADVFLIAMLKHADKRMKEAEKRAAKAEAELARVTAVSKKDRRLFIEEAAYKELRDKITLLETTLGEKRKDLDLYMSRYHALAKPEAKKLEDL